MGSDGESTVGAARRPLGLRVDPRLKRALKAAAAREGETMEDHLHRILARELAAREPAAEGRPRREST